MEPKEIRIEFIRKDLTQTKVARDIGVSPSLVQRVIFRKAVSRPVSQGIADALGLPIEFVFPELSECRRAACN
ncbi:MAG: helix-turn-helix domain-containing protein [Desulfobacterales bacterium]|jgi:transcriptional regulator with XRE-family HTH domain|nr:helix-turn-helix domain-containing protein [Desulfobacterales bacterium]MCU0601264.1 helix-turn-helix domain-containing protein [Desulfobacterales bacterium]